VESIEELSIGTLAGRDVDELAIEAEYAALLRVAQRHYVVDDPIEYRPQVDV
jgi:hypothetical protein